MSGQTPNVTISDQLSGLLRRSISDEDRARAALHVLDWAGCAVAGAASPAARALRSTLGRDRSPLDDGIYLGAIGNVLEMDDVDKRALLHPGPVVIPAAIIAARDSSASGQEFLDAVVRGYEAMIRVGRAVGQEHYKIWHNTSTCGPFGAAAAAGSLYGLNVEKMSGALGLAGTQSAGPWQVRHEPQTHAKQLHTGRAVHAGLLAVRAVANDFIGLKTIFEGEQGFFKAMCGSGDPQSIVAFGEKDPWVIHDVSFKPWPACRHAHAAIDCAMALRNASVTSDDISTIEIRTYHDARIFCDNPAPESALSAKFSLQHSVAVAFDRGAPTLNDFEEETRSDPSIVALRRRITVVEDDIFSNRYPARFGTTLTVILKNGDKKEVTVSDALGDPENPIQEHQLRDKAMMLMQEGQLSEASISTLTTSIQGMMVDDRRAQDFIAQLTEAISI